MKKQPRVRTFRSPRIGNSIITFVVAGKDREE
jgi:hypothetical protein